MTVGREGEGEGEGEMLTRYQELEKTLKEEEYVVRTQGTEGEEEGWVCALTALNEVLGTPYWWATPA